MINRQSTSSLFRTLPHHHPVDAADAAAAVTHAVAPETHQNQPIENPINLEEFDLLAGHDFGNTTQFIPGKDDSEEEKILVWQKLETNGYQPAAREGHSAVTNGLSVIIFGGFEAGKRVNNTVILDVGSVSWTVADCKGLLPPPRAYHAACSIENLVLIHGGEGLKPSSPTSQTRSLILEDSNSSVLYNSNNNNSTTGQKTSTILQGNAHPLGKMKGVCPGDNIASSKFHGNPRYSTPQQQQQMKPTLNNNNNINNNSQQLQEDSNSQATTIPLITCLDDMYALDTISYVWYPIQCALSPLPRKGHSLNSCILPSLISNGSTKKRLTLIMFGGYSIENVTLSNSLFVCEAKSIIDYYERSKKRYMERQKSWEDELNVSGIVTTKTSVTQSPSKSIGGINDNLKVSDIPPIVWKSVSCRGAAPAPRYRHSSCIANGTSNEPLLIIVGGIGKDPAVAFNDIFILDIQNQTWINLINGNDCLTAGIGGDGPIAGIYGHVCFPITKPPSTNFHEQDENPKNEIIIFGGSSNTMSMKSNCYSSMFGFDLETHTWRKVPTGHTFPASRTNHSVSLVHGWSPDNMLPGKKPPKPSLQVPNITTELRTCAVVFGGVGAIQCAADAWALDLSWKPAGFKQYQNSIEHMIDENISQANQGLTVGEESFLADVYQTQGRLNLGKSFSATAIQGTGTHGLHKVQNTLNKKYLHTIANSVSATHLQKVRLATANRRPTLTKSADANTDAGSTFAGIPLVEDINIPSEDEYGNRALFKTLNNNNSYESLTPGAINQKQGLYPIFDDQLANTLILKLRKERALSDIQLQQERDQNIVLNDKIVLLTDELQKTQEQVKSVSENHEKEIHELKKLLADSLKREEKLKQLNEEAYLLLTLNSAERLSNSSK